MNSAAEGMALHSFRFFIDFRACPGMWIHNFKLKTLECELKTSILCACMVYFAQVDIYSDLFLSLYQC